MTWRPTRPTDPSDRSDPSGWADLPDPLLAFWTERHLCLLTTRHADGSPHVVPVGVALDVERECAWIITRGGSQKVRNLERDPVLAVGQVDGGRWSTLYGLATVRRDEASVARACERYAARYRVPRPNPERVALEVAVERIAHSARL